MWLPKPDESMVGGHAVLIVGYNDEIGCFIVRILGVRTGETKVISICPMNTWQMMNCRMIIGLLWMNKSYCY